MSIIEKFYGLVSISETLGATVVTMTVPKEVIAEFNINETLNNYSVTKQMTSVLSAGGLSYLCDGVILNLIPEE